VSSDGTPGLTKLACGACITVGALKYKNYQEQDREELWFTERVEVELFVATNPPLRMSSSGSLEQAPIVRRDSSTVVRGDSVIYGEMQNSFYCIGVNDSAVVEVASSSASVAVTIVPTNLGVNDTFEAAYTATLQAYGVFDGNATFIPLRESADYDLNAGFVGASQNELYNETRFQAIARGLSQYNQAGMPFVPSPWAETANLTVSVHTVTVNGTDFDVTPPVEVTISNILFNSGSFPLQVNESVTLNYNNTASVEADITVVLDYSEPSVISLDVVTRVTCGSADKLDIGWLGGNSSFPGPLLQELQSGRCLAVTTDTYYKDSFLVALEACNESSDRQKWDYYSETVLQNVGNSLCMTVADEGNTIARVRMVDCSSANLVLEQGPFSFVTNPFLIMQEQDCFYEFVSETSCPEQCGGAFKTVTWNIKSPSRGSGQACPESEVACGLSDCPDGEGSPGGFLVQTFPDAAVGVKLLRTTLDLTLCLQYNASGQNLFSVATCDISNKFQQLDSAQLPQLLWKEYRSVRSQSIDLTFSKELAAKFSAGGEKRYMSDLVFSQDCGSEAVVSRVRFNASTTPGVEVTCLLAARKFQASTSERVLAARRGDVIEGIYGGNCIRALQLDGGEVTVQKQKCNFAEEAQRWYWSAGGNKLYSELGEDLCLLPKGGSTAVFETDDVVSATVGACAGALDFTLDAKNRLTSSASGVNNPKRSKVCLGWLGEEAVFYKCLGKNGQFTSGGNKMTFYEQQWRVGNGLMGLRDVVIDCSGAASVAFLSFYQGGVTYICQELAAVGECFLQETRQVDTDTPSLDNLLELDINCGEQAVIKQATPEYSLGGKWLMFRYVCCRVTEPSAIVPTGRFVTNGSAEIEGVYCPLPERDISGRLTYQQRSCYNDSACINSPIRQMAFDHKSGAWCVEGDCVTSDIAVPTDATLVGTNWEALPVLDFDFEPPARGASSTKKTRKPPQLIEFSAETPEFAEECQDEVTPGRPGFDREAMNEVGTGLPDENPCSLVAAKSGEGRAVYTDSVNGDEKYGYTYSDVVDCWDRDIARQKDQSDQDQLFGFLNVGWDAREALGEIACAALPAHNGGWAGIGAGGDVGYSFQDLCSALNIGVLGVLRGVTNSIELVKNFNRQKSDRDDCKETTAGLSRIFCDLHCIRDAVKAGDQAILDSMEKAARIQTANTKLLVEYNTNLILDRLSDTGTASTLRQEQAQAEAEAREAQRHMASLFEEMRSWASSGSFGAAGAKSVSRALSKYVVDGGALLNTGVNTSLQGLDLTSGLEQLVKRTASLHAAFRGAATQKLSKSAEVERRVFQFATQKQEMLRKMSRILGVYKHRSEVAKRGQQRLLGLARTSTSDLARQMERQSTESLLLSLDSTWWELRAIIDQQLEASSAQMQAFSHVTGLLQDYMSACSMAYPDVLAGYHKAVASANRAKQQLKEAWQRAVPLYGLLASKVVDGDAFTHMARADLQAVDPQALHAGAAASKDGNASTSSLAQICGRDTSGGGATQAAKEAMKRAVGGGNGLFVQTIQQLNIVAVELSAMGDRFEASGLGRAPLMQTVSDASQRLALALERAAVGYDALLSEAVADLQRRSC